MSNERILLGQFLKRRSQARDSQESPYAPDGIVAEGKSFLDVDTDLPLGSAGPSKLPPPPNVELNLSRPAPVQPSPDIRHTTPASRQPSPEPVRTHPAGLQGSPEITLAHAASSQPSLQITPSRPAGGVIPITEPVRTMASGLQPSLGIGMYTGPTTQIVGFNQVNTVASPAQSPNVSSKSKIGSSHSQPTETVDKLTQAYLNDKTSEKFSDSSINRDFLGSLRTSDQRVIEFISKLDDPIEGKFAPNIGPGGPVGDTLVFAKNVRNLGNQLGKVKLGLHALTQVSLFSLNRWANLWNPMTLANPPGLINFIPAQADILTGGPNPKSRFPGGFELNEAFNDRQLAIAQGKYTDFMTVSEPPFGTAIIKGGAAGPGLLPNIMMRPRFMGANSQDESLLEPFAAIRKVGSSLVDAALDVRNRYTPDRRYSKGRVAPLSDLYKSSLNSGPESESDLTVIDKETGLKHAWPEADFRKRGLNQLFSKYPVSLSSNVIEYRPDPDLDYSNTDVELQKASYSKGIVPVQITGENSSGFLQTDKNLEITKLTEEDSYMPLSFTDIRSYGAGKLRTVFFRAFLTNLSEEFSPNWNEQEAYGRVDPILTYMNTGRSLSLSFLVHAFAPEDLKMIYYKLHWLTSMVYPEYDSSLVFKSGPVIRVRVGDLISSGIRKGQTAVIRSLSVDYSDQLWELEVGSKVPMGYTVTMSLTIVHEVPIGRGADGKFGGLGSIDANGKYSPPDLDTKKSKDGKAISYPVVSDGMAVSSFAGSDVNDYDAAARSATDKKEK